MKNKYQNGLFIYRRDFRTIDNNGLNLLNSMCDKIYAVFIFTPEQVGQQNDYKSDNAVQFMIQSLEDLDHQIKKHGGKLHCFYGNNNTIIKKLIEALDIQVLAFNLDCTPYAIERDLKIMDLCKELNVDVQHAHDYYLHEPGTILSGSGTPYQKFTPYYNTAKKKPVQSPTGFRKISFVRTNKSLDNTISLELAMDKFTKINPNILLHGGRDNALKQMKVAAKNIKDYTKTRDELAKPTSQLSAYIKFGCLSIREVYDAFKSKHDFTRQLYWRDFYANVIYNFPHVLGHSLKPKYDKIKWHHNERLFDAWKKGITGIPLVDASQRQLLQTGWTQNRGRMISSSILTKIFLIDWRKGEKFYAQRLYDYDVANNNGGWQWSAGTGADAQPYFRYFNPYLQSKEHDEDCEYIKTWIPELKDVPPQDIHDWENTWMNYKDTGYPKPIINYKEQKDISMKMYKDALY
jgi:deoxyribodipyrimidine photo-lyase